jgi:diaminohydroxyphosphoribosylaminopyrimidine deaminase/5-amino-6-(5-phosphoribosylamino)uracil reductase
MRAWSDAGAEVVLLGSDETGAVSLAGLLDVLGKRDVQGLLIEGGATLAWSAVRQGLVDRVVFYIAPLLVGGSEAPTAVGGDGFAPIASAIRLGPLEVEMVGDDMKVVADVHGHR